MIIISRRPSRHVYGLVRLQIYGAPNAAGRGGIIAQLIKAVDARAFGVHVDVCNLIDSPEWPYDNGGIIDAAFQKLDRWILPCHAKDVEPERLTSAK